MLRALPTEALAAVLGVSRATLRKHLADGTVPGFKLGGRWRSPDKQIEDWMADQCRRITEPQLVELPPYRSGHKARKAPPSHKHHTRPPELL